MSKKPLPHPWHEGQPLYGRPQNMNSSFLSFDNSGISDDISDKDSPSTDKSSHRRQQQLRAPSSFSSSGKTIHRSSRLWQLPKDSIARYAQWIREKSPSDQTPAERLFLRKCMNRLYLCNKNRGNKPRRSSRELQARPSHAITKAPFLQQNRRRWRERKRNDKNVTRGAPDISSCEMVMVWERPATNNQESNVLSAFCSTGNGVTANSLIDLQKRMEKCWLSLENRNEADTNKVPSGTTG